MRITSSMIKNYTGSKIHNGGCAQTIWAKKVRVKEVISLQFASMGVR
jgi:hypothetical protein